MKKKILNSLSVIKDFYSEDSEIQTYLKNIEDRILLIENTQRSFDFESTEGTNVDFYLYSDGACRGNPGPGAWGVVGQNSEEMTIFEASSFVDETTNNQMELLGAIKAIELLIEFKENKNLEELNVELYTDSKYVVDGIKSWIINWKKRNWKKSDGSKVASKELWQQLDEARNKIGQIKFKWVKGHNNHPQNERCDELCNEVLDRESY